MSDKNLQLCPTNLMCASKPLSAGFAGLQESTTSTTYKFTGKERDTESGNDYFGARYYISVTGRFLTVDTVFHMEDPQSLNKYTYVRNDPVNLIDPDGREVYPVPGVINGGTVWAPYWDPLSAILYGNSSGVAFSHDPTQVTNAAVAIGLYTGWIGATSWNAVMGAPPVPSIGTSFSTAQGVFANDANSLAKKTFGKDCQKDFAALGLNGNTIQQAAGSVVFKNAVGSDVLMSSLYQSSPVEAIRNAGATMTGTVDSFVASHPGTVAVAQLGGNIVYLNAGLINPNNYWYNMATVLHELLHNASGLTDPDIQDKLGLSQNSVSDNITQKLLGDCF